MDDPLDEQTSCGLMLQVFIHHTHYPYSIKSTSYANLTYFSKCLSLIPYGLHIMQTAT